MDTLIIGAGWLGTPLASALANEGFQVTASHRSADHFPENTEYQPIVFPSEEGWSLVGKASVIVLAFPPGRTSPHEYPERCLEIARRSSETAHILLISSTGVYPDEINTFTEKDLVLSGRELSPPAKAEYLLRQLIDDRLTVIRMGGLIGPERYPVRAMASGGKTYDGSVPVNVIHQKDAVGLIVFLIRRNHRGITVNACSPAHPPRGTFYTRMAEKMQLPIPDFSGTPSGGKIIDSGYSVRLGYHYRFPDPLSYPETTP